MCYNLFFYFANFPLPTILEANYCRPSDGDVSHAVRTGARSYSAISIIISFLMNNWDPRAQQFAQQQAMQQQAYAQQQQFMRPAMPMMRPPMMMAPPPQISLNGGSFQPR